MKLLAAKRGYIESRGMRGEYLAWENMMAALGHLTRRENIV
jgi:hypothetical protein